MLLRMYTRYGNAKGFKVEILDYQAGDEAGIKSVTLSFERAKCLWTSQVRDGSSPSGTYLAI